MGSALRQWASNAPIELIMQQVTLISVVWLMLGKESERSLEPELEFAILEMIIALHNIFVNFY